MAKVLIVGCGDIGYRVGLALFRQGHAIVGLKRSPIAASPFPMLAADICQPESLVPVSTDFDLVLFIVSPDRRDSSTYQALFDQGLGHLLAHFDRAGRQPKWLMVSSTSVYGQNQGEWLDETSSTNPDSATARWLVAGEKRLWQNDPAHCVVRFAGIYGPGRNWWLRRLAADEPIRQQPPSYSNRIHRDDCVNVLLFLALKQLAGAALQNCYLAGDDEPAPCWEVAAWLAGQRGYPAPRPLILPDGAPQNKRCSNLRLKQLGYRFLYPGYRDGYAAMFAADDEVKLT